MSGSELVRDYGYWAIVVGTFFEGELVMLAAGVAACAGLLSLPGVILAGMAGIFASDTFCFLLGRFAGERFKGWFPRLHARLGGVFRLIERHDEKLVVCFQFLPGLCTVTPVAFGMSKISTLRFMTLDFVGNAFWTLIFSLGGFLFGSAFERLVRDAREWQWLAGGVMAIAALVLWQSYHAWSGRITRAG
jgi:membrane protein DedA with SNARE-associated domain